VTNRIPEQCNSFRELLERALCEPAAQLQPLAWHEHLNACSECRRLLEEEEALEYLLTSLPEPRLPEALVERVLTRLREEHAPADLDTLLDLDHLNKPAGLTSRVLSELDLDRLLAQVPEIEPPAGLSARVLAALESERKEKTARVFSLGRFAALAASLLAVLGLWALRGDDKIEPPLADGPADQIPSDEMLALLDILGEETLWVDDAWKGDDMIDIALSLDEGDELLLEYLSSLAEEEDEEKNG